MQIIFAGTPEIAKVVLEKLLQSKHDIVAVLTQPDRPAGRGQKLQVSPVKQLAQLKNLPVLQPESLKSADIQETLRQLGADLMVVVAYGLLLPKAVLDLPKYGCWNVHVSLLPRWRGAAPIQRAIEAGDMQTGVSIMQMDEGLDTGAILLQQEVQILPEDTALSLHDRLAEVGGDALLKALELFASGHLQAQVQATEGVTYAQKLRKDEGVLDFSLSALELERKVRAFYPWPMAHVQYNEVLLKVGQVSVADTESQGPIGQIIDINPEFILVQTALGRLRFHALQMPGGKMLNMREFLNGHRDFFIEGSEFT